MMTKGGVKLPMINDIFTNVGEIVTEVADLLVQLFESAVSIFFTTGEDGGLTVIGVLTLIGVGFGLVMWAFNYISKLIKFK